VPVLNPIAGHVIQFRASHGWPPPVTKVNDAMRRK
jgi:hypothetical protein